MSEEQKNGDVSDKTNATNGDITDGAVKTKSKKGKKGAKADKNEVFQCHSMYNFRQHNEDDNAMISFNSFV